MKELGDRRLLDSVTVDQPKRPQRIARLVDPTDPRHLQRRNVAHQRDVLCHAHLHESSPITRDHTRSEAVR
jgi:hypothetical protein